MTGTSSFDAWNYREGAGVVEGNDLVGYKVSAQDGDIGKVDEATYDVNAASLVVDTGPWIFGKKVLLPAGVVERADHDEQTVSVDLTKDQIKDAPEYDTNASTGTDTLSGKGVGYVAAADEEYRARVAGYYEGNYSGSRGGAV